MYGYEPPKEPTASWKEIIQLSWIAMTIVMPVIGGVILVMILVASFFFFLSVNPALTLIPIGVFAGAALILILIDRRNQARLEAQSRGDDSPY